MTENKTELRLFIKLLETIYQSGDKIKGLNAQEEWYLDIIYAAGEISSSELAKLTGVTKSAITPVTKKFLEKGIVTKRQSTDDRRTYYLTVSEDYKKKYENAFTEEDNPLVEFAQVLSSDEKEEFNVIVNKLLK